MLDWLAQLLGLPAGLARPHRGHRLDLHVRRARRRARGDRPRSSSAPSTRTRRSRRRRGCSARLRKVPVDADFRMRVDALGPDRCRRRRRDRRHDRRRPSVDPVPAIADACAPAGVAARGRGLRRLGHGLPRVSLGVRRGGAGRLAGGERAQVAVHPDGLLAALDAPARGPAPRLQPDARVPAHPGRRGRAQPDRLRPGARAALPRAQALGGAALPRPPRAAGANPRARRLATKFERWVARGRAGSSARPASSRSCASACEGDDERNRRLLERVNASGEIFISHRAGRSLRAAPGHRQMRTTEEDVQRAWEVLVGASRQAP